MTVIIDPRIDIYGNDGRAAVLADLLEFRALHGVSTSLADLADLIVDMGWTRKPLRQLLLPDDDEEEQPESLAEQAFTLLGERMDVLGEKYPFRLVFGRLALRLGVSMQSDPYVCVLSIAIAHAWKVPCVVPPEDALEYVVVASMAKHLNAASMGTADREGRTFVENLADSSHAVGLTASLQPRPIRSRAKDAGVDTLVTHVWADRRGGQWVFIGQVTCGKTDTWDRKLNQPKAAHWKQYLQEPLTPQRFLAVPYHVDRAFFDSLHLQDEGLVVDRLRLVLALDTAPTAALSVMDAILVASVA